VNQQRVLYTQTSDGTNIAYSTRGEGPALVYMQPYSHQGLDWHRPEMASWYGALAERFTLVRYDPRRFGLSERSDAEINVDSLVHDLEAVVDRVGLGQFDLLGASALGFSAAVYAAHHPERVRSLILWGTPPTGEAFAASQRVRSIDQILQFDEELVLELQARYIFGDEVPLTRDRLEHARVTIDPEVLSLWIRTAVEGDVREALAAVRSPTLVVYPLDSTYLTSADAQRTASLVPNAEYVEIAGSYYPYQVADQDAGIALIEDFLAQASPRTEPQPASQGFQTVMFTDLEASTALTQRLGDEGAQELLRGHNRTVRSALVANGGREVKHTGDGIMASFTSAVAAVTAALAIQRELAGGEVRVRVGLNAGEPIAEDGDLFGTAVQLAARVTDRAEPGQVLVTRVVADLCAGKTFRFSSIGPVSMKGLDEAVELFEVRAGGAQ
jgi:class 3 adenylate cyclase/pimeloyl-ACP methyl ester carboxylesterase